ncbi:MAG: hypothetical protein KI785_03240 [Devosiaceae bacterium]|nr:hypothetical protein [Devosiaceae bacterium MH13]
MSLPRTLRVVPVLVAAGLLAGCASYGSIDESEAGLEESLFGGALGILGTPDTEDEIEYSSRPPLVRPPQEGALPAPQEDAVATSDPNWPTGSQERLEQVYSSDEAFLVFSPGTEGVDIDATQEFAARQRNPQTPARDPDRLSEPLTPEQMQAANDRARLQAEAARPVTRERRFLTDPPVEARRPAQGADYATADAAGVAPEDDSPWWRFW